jgi:hypothetical protein
MTTGPTLAAARAAWRMLLNKSPRMSPLRRFAPLLIAGAAFIAAACSDAVAPTRPTTARALPTLVSAFGGGPASYANLADDDAEAAAKTVVFTMSPEGGKAQIGAYVLNYPANVVCDPSTTAYGPSEWHNPCETLNEPITITVKYWTENGHVHSDFSPDIRFDPSKTVTISTYDHALVGLDSSAQSNYFIWYSVRVGDFRYFIDDFAVDPDVATIFATDSTGLATGLAKRRVLHFSGYLYREGVPIWCEDGALDNDPLCVEILNAP